MSSEVRSARGVIGRTVDRKPGDTRDTIDRLRELIEPAVQRAADTGEAQAVDVTAIVEGLDVDVQTLALVQRAIDAAVRGTALTGYVVTLPTGRGMGLAAVIRVPDRMER